MERFRADPIARRALGDYLRPFGLRLSEISVEGWDEAGYVYVDHGRPITIFSTARRAWPAGFDINHFRKLVSRVTGVV